MTWHVNLFQNGEPDAWDEHNMGPTGPMINQHIYLSTIKDIIIGSIFGTILKEHEMNATTGKNNNVLHSK